MTRRMLQIFGMVSVALLTLLATINFVYAQDAGPQAIDAPQGALGTAFTYQGQLKSGGVGVTGSCEMVFRLYDALTVGNPVGLPLTQTVAVNASLFTTQLDFGASAFNGQARWLEMAVKCGSDTAFTALSRQALTPAPYALYAPTAGTAANVTNGVYTTGAYANPAWLTSLAGSKISGAVATATTAGSAPWSGVTGIPAGFADGVDDTGSDWHLTGNSGTNPTTNFIGTTDNQALVFKVNNLQILRLEPNSTSPNIIGGRFNNTVTSGVHGATISGGGAVSSPNQVSADFGSVGGGSGNEAGGSSSTVGGGQGNMASGYQATIGGGDSNTASGYQATIGGGNSNMVGAGGTNATIAGGWYNDALDDNATVGGGENNVAGGWASTVPGGYGNTASGQASFAAGERANAVHDGAFVWADATLTPFTSTLPNQFLVRAGGGVGINTSDTSANALTVNGQVIAGGTGVPTGSAEPFVARGGNAGLSLDDRGDADLRWVVFANGGSLRFWNGAERMSVSGAGVLTIGALGSAGSTTLCRNASNQIATCSSSIRYKDNVSVLDLGLETVAQLRPVTFDWTSTGEHDLGFVAEEVAEVTPLLTTQNTAGQIEGVKYDRITAVLVNAVQEQQQQIKDLQQQNADLQARLANLDPTTPASFNVFNALSVLAMVAVVGLFWQQRRVKRGES